MEVKIPIVWTDEKADRGSKSHKREDKKKEDQRRETIRRNKMRAHKKK